MGLMKAAFFGALAGVGIATAGSDVEGMLGDAIRWHILHLRVDRLSLFFSIPIFLGVTLFGWAMMSWSRD